jgi:alkaline phosphatase D
MAYQAYYEHMPFRAASVPAAGGMRIHRRARVGTLLDLHLLDTRQFRTDQPCGDNFQSVCAGVADPQARMMSADEEAWLFAGLADRRARWQAVAQQVMVMPLDRRTHGEPAPVRNMDSWAGYDAPRERLLAHMAGLGNAVVLTGDEHQNYAGVLRRNAGRGEAVAAEFVGTSISSGGDGADKRAGEDRIRAENPYLAWTNDRRGYLTCEVTSDAWTTRYRTVERVTLSGAPVTTAATVTVPHGRPELSID